jgi:hypothetical protein
MNYYFDWQVNNEGDLDYSMIRYHLTRAVSGAWQLAMLQAIDTCGKAIKCKCQGTQFFFMLTFVFIISI